jgi:hypothetical protein
LSFDFVEEQIANIKKANEIDIATEKENQRKVVELNLHKKTLADIEIKYENITRYILQDWEDKISNTNS